MCHANNINLTVFYNKAYNTMFNHLQILLVTLYDNLQVKT